MAAFGKLYGNAWLDVSRHWQKDAAGMYRNTKTSRRPLPPRTTRPRLGDLLGDPPSDAMHRLEPLAKAERAGRPGNLARLPATLVCPTCGAQNVVDSPTPIG